MATWLQYRMKLIPVTRIDDPRLEIYRSFRENAFRADGSFVADSPHVVKLLMQEGVRIQSLLATERFYKDNAVFLARFEIPQAYVAPRSEIEKIVGHKIHHNVMMHAYRPAPSPIEALGNRIVMLDEISKADNIGAIARSAAALGATGYLLPEQGPHPYNRRAVRISTGHIARVRYSLYDDPLSTLSRLKSLGYRLFAAEVTPDATPLSRVVVPERYVIVLGHEKKGLSPDILALCDETIAIEMEPGIKSFNIAVAASIILYRFRTANLDFNNT